MRQPRTGMHGTHRAPGYLGALLGMLALLVQSLYALGHVPAPWRADPLAAAGLTSPLSSSLCLAKPASVQPGPAPAKSTGSKAATCLICQNLTWSSGFAPPNDGSGLVLVPRATTAGPAMPPAPTVSRIVANTHPRDPPPTA